MFTIRFHVFPICLSLYFCSKSFTVTFNRYTKKKHTKNYKKMIPVQLICLNFNKVVQVSNPVKQKTKTLFFSQGKSQFRVQFFRSNVRFIFKSLQIITFYTLVYSIFALKAAHVLGIAAYTHTHTHTHTRTHMHTHTHTQTHTFTCFLTSTCYVNDYLSKAGHHLCFLCVNILNNNRKTKLV